MKTSAFLDAICETLQLPAGSVSLDDTPKTVAPWDSLGHLAIIDLLVTHLGLDTSEDESLQQFSSIRELVDRLKGMNALEDDA